VRRVTLLALGGSLLADVLLVLAVFLLATNTPTAASTPTPLQTLIGLEPSPHVWQLTVDPEKLLKGDPQAIKEVNKQVEVHHDLTKRRAGFVLVYGGARSQEEAEKAEQVASKVAAILQESSQHGQSVFTGTVFYVLPFILGKSLNTVKLDIYLSTH